MIWDQHIWKNHNLEEEFPKAEIIMLDNQR